MYVGMEGRQVGLYRRVKVSLNEILMTGREEENGVPEIPLALPLAGGMWKPVVRTRQIFLSQSHSRAARI